MGSRHLCQGFENSRTPILSPDKTRIAAGTPVPSLLRRFECVETVCKVATQRTLLKHILPSFKVRTEFLAGVGYY